MAHLVQMRVVDRLVTAALAAAPTGIIYVPRGRRQPTVADNPSAYPWFTHKLRAVGIRKHGGNAAQADRVQLQVTLAVFCTAGATVEYAYAMSAAMDLAAPLLAYQYFSDSPQTHLVELNGYEAETDFLADSGDGGVSRVDCGLLVFNGFAEKINEGL